MVQRLAVVMIFISPTLQVIARVLTLTWVIVTCNRRATDMAQVTPKACSQEATISSLMKSKYFTRRNDIDII